MRILCSKVHSTKKKKNNQISVTKLKLKIILFFFFVLIKTDNFWISEKHKYKLI